MKADTLCLSECLSSASSALDSSNPWPMSELPPAKALAMADGGAAGKPVGKGATGSVVDMVVGPKSGTLACAAPLAPSPVCGAAVLAATALASLGAVEAPGGGVDGLCKATASSTTARPLVPPRAIMALRLMRGRLGS